MTKWVRGAGILARRMGTFVSRNKCTIALVVWKLVEGATSDHEECHGLRAVILFQKASCPLFRTIVITRHRPGGVALGVSLTVAVSVSLDMESLSNSEAVSARMQTMRL
jgi:hypothetical protein